jgi:hypothetical protein
MTFSLLILLRDRATRGRPEQLRATAHNHFTRRGTRWTRLAARLSMCATRAVMPYGLLAFALLNLLPAFLVLAAFAAQVYWVSLALELTGLLRSSVSSEIAGGVRPIAVTTREHGPLA